MPTGCVKREKRVGSSKNPIRRDIVVVGEAEVGKSELCDTIRV